MIEFVTLFLGLVTGPQTVDLAVQGPFARVELRLDGERVGMAPAPPYRFRVDFGDRLEPRRLEARGYAENGEVVLTAEQTVNLPRLPVALRVFLGQRRDDGSREGRLVWRAVGGAQPAKVEVALDGVPLEVRGFRSFELPPLPGGGEAIRVLTASLELATGVADTATVLLGGAYGESVSAQLTAIPIRVEPGAKLPAAAEMSGWIRDGEEALDVKAVEARRAEVVVVRARGSWEPLAEMASRFDESRYRAVGNLGPGRTVRLLDPVPLAAPEGKATSLEFALSQPLTPGYGGVPVLLGTFHRTDERGRRREARRGPAQRISNAVAAAAVTAAGSQAARTVLLVLGEDEEDASTWSPEMVRGYLKSLRVPLVVWSTTPPDRRRRPERLAAWGDVVDISGEARYLDAVGALLADLGTQQVLWVEGERFLHRLRASPLARGFRLLE